MELSYQLLLLCTCDNVLAGAKGYCICTSFMFSKFLQFCVFTFLMFFYIAIWRSFCFLVVKIYFHAKFWPSSSKIEQFGRHFVFGGHFVFWWPFYFLAKKMRRVIMNYLAKCWASSLKIDSVMPNLVFGGHFVFWRPFFSWPFWVFSK